MVKFSLLAVLLLLIAIGGGYWYGLNKPVNKPSQSSVQVTPNSTGSAATTDYTSWQTCTNTSKNFTIKYPNDWVTLSTAKADSCQFFATTAANLSANKAKIVINSSLDQKSLADLITSTKKSNEEQLLLNARLVEIGGHNFDRVETEATGVGSGQKGTRTTTYFLTDPVPLAIITVETERGNIESSSQIFERVVASLQF